MSASQIVSRGLDLRHEARVGRSGYGADEAGRRYDHLIASGFCEEAADRVFEAINLPDCDFITRRLSDLRELGFADPVKMITSFPAILGYARDRLLLVAGIVAGLRDRVDGQVARLISKPRSLIEAVAAAAPETWAEVLELMRSRP